MGFLEFGSQNCNSQYMKNSPMLLSYILLFPSVSSLIVFSKFSTEGSHFTIPKFYNTIACFVLLMCKSKRIVSLNIGLSSP